MGFLLLIPFFLIRFGLLYALNKQAVRRAAHFAPITEQEKPALVIYQISNIAVFVYLLFLVIKIEPTALFYSGIVVYAIGLVLLTISMIYFARPAKSGVNQQGIYRLSRNPMYVAYFVFFIGCVLLTQSWILLALVAIFQIASHWIIRSEERWCIDQFGDEYLAYMSKTRRYL